ncbi:GntR family transcriptional regulator [Rothia sp. HC945]|uniref:GntR family transcriptional regulator n=1 Tax=Rothia sp. HC945 TaxID=3171170 RepID=UPI002654389E|nr:GntR family transcriptional regulator [Kocuria sp.]MDN5653979.1 GntR family transcriptional regulator [Kocuria sp.]
MKEQASRAGQDAPRTIDWTDDGAAREFFSVRLDSGVPPYAQLRRRVVEARHTGELESGTRLPPVRKLAASLHLANNTVAKAYKELEAAGVVETKGRAGSFVRAGSSVEDKALKLTHKFLAELKNIGLNQNEAEALVRRVIDEETPLSSEQ